MKGRRLACWVLLIGMVFLALMGGCSGENPRAVEGPREAPSQPETSPMVPTVPSPPEHAQPQRPSLPPADTFRKGGEAVIALPDRLPAFDPLGFERADEELSPLEGIAYRGLLAAGADQVFQPSLVEGFHWEKNSAYPAVRLTMQNGLRWSDGKPVTPEDIVYTLETFAKPDYYGAWRQHMHLVEGVSAFRAGTSERISGITVDSANRSIRIQLTRDDVRFLQALTAPLLPRHQLAERSLREIEELASRGAIAGTGPFRPVSIQANGWRFAANPHYHEGAPQLSSVRVVPLPAERLPAEVNAGRVHLGWMTPEIAAGQLSQLAAPLDASQAAANAPASVIRAEAGGYHFLGFNLASPALWDVTVRRALAQALPVSEISAKQFYGVAEAADSPLPPLSFAHAARPAPAYDLADAGRVLKQAGYTRDKPLTLTVVYPKDRVHERLLNEITSAWSQLPVKLVTQALERAEFHSYVFGASPYDCYLFGWKDTADPAGLIELWHSRSLPGERGYNASNYRNDVADQLLEQGTKAADILERKRIFTEWQTQFSTDLPILPLVRIPNYYLVSSRIAFVASNTAATHPYGSIHLWRLVE